MRESEIEQRLGRELRRLGCLYYKFTSPGAPGVPDRIVISKTGNVTFCEIKTDTGRLSRQQQVRQRELINHGQNAVVLYGWDDCEAFLRSVKEDVLNVAKDL